MMQTQLQTGRRDVVWRMRRHQSSLALPVGQGSWPPPAMCRFPLLEPSGAAASDSVDQIA